MKRPSGFDRSPEPRWPEPVVPAGRGRSAPPEPTASAEPAPDSGAPAPPGSPVLRRAVARAAAAPADRGDAGAPDPAAGDPAAPGAAADLAATVDLSEARGAGAPGADPDDDGRPSAPRAGLPERLAAPLAPLARRRAARDRDPVREAERRVREAERLAKARIRRERRRFSAEARRRRRVWWIAAGAVAALALFVAVGALTPLMAVRDVRVVGADAVDAAEVEAALAGLEGTPLALVEDGDVHRALDGFARIQRYAVERVPPHTLVVRIEERVPVIALRKQGEYRVYDAAGVLLSTREKAPKSVPVGKGAISDLSSEAFAAATRALRDLPDDLRARVDRASATSAQDLVFTLDDGIEVVWGEAEETQRKAVVLEAMLEALADRDVTRIDVSSSEAPVYE